LLDLHHALAHHRRGLWGDDAKAPKSVLLFREGDGQSETFGAGAPEPALEWLLGRAWRTIALWAPNDWRAAVEHRVGAVERVETSILSASGADLRPVSTAVAVRRMTADDPEPLLLDLLPDWALFGWTSVRDLVEHAAGFVVPHGARYAALAWVYSQTKRYDAIGVTTAPRFRRLGLGRAVASALIHEIVHLRRKVPVWTTNPGNAASLALARSLGFSQVVAEPFLRWRPATVANP
jgi:GNAT superfamily N-acetyltransferase